MRTPEEIVERVENSMSFLGFEKEVWVPFLPFEYAKPFLKDEATQEKWSTYVKTEADIIPDMRDYMEFAWGKVIDHRGISASRSVEKMAAWLWLLGDEELVEFAQREGNYAMYGAPILAAICKKYDFPIPEDESLQNMIAGLPCGAGCYGCGTAVEEVSFDD